MTKPFKPMLADPPEPEKFPLRFPFYGSPKYDGIRCIITEDGPVTRKLKPIPNRALRDVLSHILLLHLDGELLAGDPMNPNAMQATTSAVMGFEADFSQVKFYVFDHIEYPELPFSKRQEYLQVMYRRCAEVGLPVVLVPQVFIKDEEDLTAYVTKCLEAGYEGVILRSPTSPYKYGRSTAKEQYLLKIKPWEDAEAKVIGFVEQFENTNEAQEDNLGHTKRSTAQDGLVGKGTLGAFVVEIEGWKEKTMQIGTGQGLDMKLRQEVWDNREKYLGSWLKYQFQRIGSKDRPRIPIFLGFRHPDDMS
jgi:DNA ligase-1